MPKKRHAQIKTKKVAQTSSKQEQPTISTTPPFLLSGETSPLLTLLFDSKQAQHACLSRMEAFYESTNDRERYLTLQEAKELQICNNYEAYNFPIRAVRQWLQCMHDANLETPDSNLDGLEVLSENENENRNERITRWWEEYCNPQENYLLSFLESLGALSSDSNDPVYLISTISSKKRSLYHERLHYLYYISPEYRDKVGKEYNSLGSRAIKIIQQDLTMRKYSENVWIDEFQAYVSENAGEFGQSIQQECQSIKSRLNMYQRDLSKRLKLM